jgi:Flp pilus assembly protein TadD
LDPGDEKAFYNRGISHIHLRQYERALNDFDRVTQINSKYALAYTSRGLAYLRLGRLKEALQDQDMAIKIDATLVPAYINRGVILVELKCYKEAQQDFSTAMRLDPSEPDIYVNMGAFHALNKNLPQAWGLFEKAAELGHPRVAMLAERAKREFFSNN